MEVIFYICVGIVAFVFLADWVLNGLILNGTPAGRRFLVRMTAACQRQADLQHSAPTVYPHILNTTSAAQGGVRKRSRLEVYPEYVLIHGGRPQVILARIPMEDITAVIQQDMSREGVFMAGLGLVTAKGQYRFISEGVFSHQHILRTARVIKAVYGIATGHELPLVDATVTGQLTPENLVHTD